MYVEDRSVGSLFAAPTADVNEVVRDFVMHVRPLSIVQINPIQAIQWQDVTYLEIDPPPTPRVESPLDLREGRWERLQRIRQVPIVQDGELIDVALFPWHLPISEAQYRLDEASIEEEDYWAISAPHCDTWVISPVYLPPILRERLQEWEDMQERERIRRGGMPETYVLSDTCSEFESSIPDIDGLERHDLPLSLKQSVNYYANKEKDDTSDDSFWDNLRVTYAYAHSPEYMCEYWIGNETSVIADMVCYFAEVNGHSTDDVVICFGTSLPKLDDMIIQYVEEVFYVVLLRYVYHVDYMGTWIWEGEDMKKMAEQQRGTRMVPSILFDYPLAQPAGPPMSYSPPRGGARQQRGMGLEAMQKQQMATWALTRCHECCPTVESKLLKTLLRESRMVSAVLHSRSTIQVVHVVIAALKRAGLTALAIALESQQPTGGRGDNHEGYHEINENDYGDGDHNNRQQPEVHEAAEYSPVTEPRPDSMPVAAQHVIDDIHHSIEQMKILHQHQYAAAMRYDLVPIIQQMQVLHQDVTTLMQQLQHQIHGMNQRIAMWETTFLPAVFERMQEIQPIQHQ